MFAATRWSVRTLATVAALGLASAPASAQFGVVIPNAKKPPQPQQPVKANQIVVPAGPKVPQAGVPRQPQANRPVLQPSVNSFPGFPTYPAANPWNPALNNPFAYQGFTNPLANPALVNPRPFNPFFNNNPLVNNNPLLANPLVNNNPFVNPLANPFIANPLLANPLAVNPLLNNPFAPNPLLNPFAVNQAVGFAPPVPAHQPGTLVYKGPNTFVNNATGAVVQPVTGTTFADGTTYYRPTGIELPNFNVGVFTPYIW